MLLAILESCDVILEFSWDSDLREAVQDIREKLDQTFLPDDVDTPSVLRYDPRLDPVLLVGLEVGGGKGVFAGSGGVGHGLKPVDAGLGRGARGGRGSVQAL